jgi:hypothetical protein
MGSIIFLVFAVIFIGSISYGWDNPCYSNSMDPKSIPRETRFTMTLESKRVRSIEGNIILYDLGKETTTIRADSLAARSFLKEVRKGRCHVREPVVLEPDTKPSSNARYRTVLALPH